MSKYPFFNASAVFFLVVGTAIGAGMVTLPMLLQHLSMSSMFLIFVLSLWIMHTTACFFIELSTEHDKQGNLLTFILRHEKALYWPTKCIYLLFFWSLLAVYLSALPSFFHEITPHIKLLSQAWFQGFLLIVFLQAPPSVQAIINKFLVLVMLAALSWIMIIGANHAPATYSHLGTINFDVTLLLPIMMFFGYHLTIPSLTRYLPDRQSLERVCLLAGIFILIIYSIWSVLMLSLVAGVEFHDRPFIQVIASLVNSEQLAQVAVLFSMLAMATSCMGMSLGTQDFLNDAWPLAKKASWLSTLCTVAPSLILIYGTNGDFLKILSLASYFALYLLVILPSWLVYKKRRMNNSFPLSITGLGCALGLFTFFTKI